jgi:hypothetical protein
MLSDTKANSEKISVCNNMQYNNVQYNNVQDCMKDVCNLLYSSRRCDQNK